MPSEQKTVKAKLAALSSGPGVYQMLDARANIIYIGKAKNLKNRVSSYFNRQGLDSKTQQLVSQIADIHTMHTESERDALLLEIALIKKYRPRYNVLFRDDKSYPYLYLSDHNQFPRLIAIRGKPFKHGTYFGPYPNMHSVRNTLKLIQKVFTVRQCSDQDFAHRSRPCLQFQIQRCSAPCAAQITVEEYREDSNNLKLFLQGKNQEVLKTLGAKMTTASDDLNFELAIKYRHQVQQLQTLQQQQSISSHEYHADIDVIALAHDHHCYCLQLLFIRQGQVLATESYFPKLMKNESECDVIDAFIKQFYSQGIGADNPPRQILLPQHPAIKARHHDFQQLLNLICDHPPKLIQQRNSNRQAWQTTAELNAKQALDTHLRHQYYLLAQFEQLQHILNITKTIDHIECFDISHTQGEATMASCVVFTAKGANKQRYRRFNINDIQAGDDYQAIYQAVYRRYKRLIAEGKNLPQLILIDGGKGQLSKAQQALTTLGISQQTHLVGVAKGPSRKAGLEQLWQVHENSARQLREDNPALHLIQQIRDEAHRFAISGMRHQRSKTRKSSYLETLSGIGEKRRTALLKHFGSLENIRQATMVELEKVEGISEKTAASLYQQLHS